MSRFALYQSDASASDAYRAYFRRAQRVPHHADAVSSADGHAAATQPPSPAVPQADGEP